MIESEIELDHTIESAAVEDHTMDCGVETTSGSNPCACASPDVNGCWSGDIADDQTIDCGESTAARTSLGDQVIEGPNSTCGPDRPMPVRTPPAVIVSPAISVVGRRPVKRFATNAAAATTLMLPAPSSATPADASGVPVSCRAALA